MDFRITETGPFENRTLEIHSSNVTYQVNNVDGSKTRKFQFHEIDSILLSEGHELSLQVKKKVYSIQIQPENQRHQQAVKKILQGVRPPLTFQQGSSTSENSKEVKETILSPPTSFLRRYGLIIVFSIILLLMLIRAFTSDRSKYRKTRIKNEYYGLRDSTEWSKYAFPFDSTEASYPHEFQDSTLWLSSKLRTLTAPKEFTSTDWNFAILFCEAKEGESVQLRIIVVKTYTDAEEIISRLENGESFSKLATEKSIHPSHAQDGAIGKFVLSDLSKEFQTALKDIQSGSYTDVIQLKAGGESAKKTNEKFVVQDD